MTTTTTRKYDKHGNPDGTSVVTVTNPEQDQKDFEDAQKRQAEAQQAQMRDTASQDWEKYKTQFDAQNTKERAGLVAAGNDIMDRAYIVHNAIQGVKNGGMYADSPQMQQRFVMNAVLGFGDAVAKARGLQLISGIENGVQTGYDGKNFNLVFRNRDGNPIVQSVSPSQFSQQLVAKGYLDADWDKPKEESAASGKGSASTAPAQKPADWRGKYANDYFENDVGEDGRALASGSRHLTEFGRAQMRRDLASASGEEREFLLRQLANAQAVEDVKADQASRAASQGGVGAANSELQAKTGKDDGPLTYEKAFDKAYGALAGKNEEPTPVVEEPPKDPLAEAFGIGGKKDDPYLEAFNAAQKERQERFEKAHKSDLDRTVYVHDENGKGMWVKASEADKYRRDEGKTGVNRSRLDSDILNRQTKTSEPKKTKYEFNQDEFDDQWLKARGFASWDDAKGELTDADMKDYEADVEREKYESQFGSPEEREQKKAELRQQRIDRYAADMANAFMENKHNDRKATIEELVKPFVDNQIPSDLSDRLNDFDVKELYKTVFIKDKETRKERVGEILDMVLNGGKRDLEREEMSAQKEAGMEAQHNNIPADVENTEGSNAEETPPAEIESQTSEPTVDESENARNERIARETEEANRALGYNEDRPDTLRQAGDAAVGTANAIRRFDKKVSSMRSKYDNPIEKAAIGVAKVGYAAGRVATAPATYGVFVDEKITELNRKRAEAERKKLDDAAAKRRRENEINRVRIKKYSLGFDLTEDEKKILDEWRRENSNKNGRKGK